LKLREACPFPTHMSVMIWCGRHDGAKYQFAMGRE